jgi:propanol-preferring alcohol dehydrogenase
MRAMLLDHPGHLLEMRDVPIPTPCAGEVQVQVTACAVCRTDLHVVDGELPYPKLPLIPGHEIVGRITQVGPGIDHLRVGDRVGIPWLGWTCGECAFCRRGQENLCDHARFTGYTIDGGYAEYTVADARFCFPLPEVTFDDASCAPWLCAGLIGYRSLRMAGDAQSIGIYGFGAAAHIVAQVAKYQHRRIFAFTRAGDTVAQDFALQLGATWAGASEELPPEPLDAAIIFAPAGPLVPAALKAVRKGGTVVCGGIHMSDIPSFPYRDLWEERTIRSVANLTRQDGHEFLSLAPQIPVQTTTQIFPLSQANEALEALRQGHLTGAAVLIPDSGSLPR